MDEFPKTETEIAFIDWLSEQKHLDYTVKFDPCLEPSYDDYDQRSYRVRLRNSRNISLQIMFTAEDHVGFGVPDIRPEKLPFVFGAEPTDRDLNVIKLVVAAVFAGQSFVRLNRFTGSRHFEVPRNLYAKFNPLEQACGIRAARHKNRWSKIVKLPYN